MSGLSTGRRGVFSGFWGRVNGSLCGRVATRLPEKLDNSTRGKMTRAEFTGRWVWSHDDDDDDDDGQRLQSRPTLIISLHAVRLAVTVPTSPAV